MTEKSGGGGFIGEGLAVSIWRVILPSVHTHIAKIGVDDVQLFMPIHIDEFNIILPSTLSINFLHPTPKKKQANTFDKRLNFQKHCSDHFSGSGKGRRNPRNYKCDVVSKFCPGLLVRT